MMVNKERVEIAIIGAMKEEIDALLVYVNAPTQYAVLNTTYYLGSLHGKRVVIFQSGIGKVGAAISTAYVLEHFTPNYLINIGSAGGFDAGFAIGDVVISTEVQYHDVDVTMIGCEYGQIPYLPAKFPADKQLLALAKKVLDDSAVSSLAGLIGTGDYFMSDEKDVKLTRSRFPLMMATDMEAAAIGHTCYLYDCPFIVIRAISDLVDNTENTVDFFSFLQIAAKNSARIVVAMVQQL